MAEILKVVADLIQTQLGLPADDVFLYNQKVDLPPEQRMFVNVAFVGSKVFGTSSRHASDPEFGLVQQQTMNAQETYQILCYSRDSTARLRKHEIVFALSGDAAEQAQAKYSFKIGYLPNNFLDVSKGEGASRLNRYALTFRVHLAYQKTQAVEYYNDFGDSPSLITNP